MDKSEKAFLTIGELASELDLPQHILRYWETRFPQLRPLQRSGNRRYYRPADVALARRIHHLLSVDGFTVRGAQKALAEGWTDDPVKPADAPAEIAAPIERRPAAAMDDRTALIARLEAVRNELADALAVS
jgi:DNA-binding transcriptional MerR regulator